jgi:hypothetical protein
MPTGVAAACREEVRATLDARRAGCASARATGRCPSQWLSPVRRSEAVCLEERGGAGQLHDITIGTGLRPALEVK